MAMSAPRFVSLALASEAARLPDAIYHFNVTAGDPLITPILLDGTWWHDRPFPISRLPAARVAEYFRYDS